MQIELYLNQKQMEETSRGFYHCTHIPIRFYASNQRPIASFGYTEDSACLIDEYHIYRKLKEKLSKSIGISAYETIVVEEAISFTGVLSCPRNLDKGIYILGPYSTETTIGPGIPYKPDKYIPNLINLLKTIEKSTELSSIKIEDNNANYSNYIKKAIDYMYENYKETITLDDISNHLNLNKCYLCSIFKKEVNKTVSQFLNEIRINKSKELLLKEGYSVLDIALHVGFNNQNYYNMTFKKLTGTTPLEYKRNSLGI
ncbi:helix-turn-helix transcriptional regulator [Alloiococcus sp. CFN-8]|uniref:helix-turn-helix transcriptional regulator n=1 Tax=Alloiococcus sp. CFN-8 TaxID=3416081 RepID=UPI003CF10FB9